MAWFIAGMVVASIIVGGSRRQKVAEVQQKVAFDALEMLATGLDGAYDRLARIEAHLGIVPDGDGERGPREPELGDDELGDEEPGEIARSVERRLRAIAGGKG